MSPLRSSRVVSLYLLVGSCSLLSLLSVTPSAAVVCSWKAGETGNWNDPGKWDCGLVPDGDDTAVLALGGTVTVSAAASVGSLSMSATSLDGDADLTVTVSMSWSGATLAGTGKLVIADTASLSIVDGGASRKFFNRPVENFGQVTVSSGPNTSGGGSLTNRLGGTVDFTNDLQFPTPQINEGTLIRSGGTGNVFFGGFTQAATGTTENQSGILFFSGGSDSIDGAIMATNKTVWFQNSASATFVGAELDIGTLAVTGNSLIDLDGADSVTLGSLYLDGGSADLGDSVVWINGDFTRTTTGSTFEAGTSKVVFGGGTTQNLNVSRATEFYTIEVTEGTRLVETVETDHSSIRWFLWNRGVIEKTKAVPVSGSVGFGLTGVELAVNDPGTFTELKVERVGGNHPSAEPSTRLEQYWLFTPTGGGFIVDLTLDHCHQPEADLRLCRYTGSSWNCGVDSVTPAAITRAGVTQLATWALGLTDPRTLQTGFDCGDPMAWSTYAQ